MYRHEREIREEERRISSKSEFNELMVAAEKLIEASKDVKDMQKEIQAAVRTVRSQYSKLLEAHDEYEFLQDNRYIHYDLLELQEMLIKAGYLHPDEQPVNEHV